MRIPRMKEREREELGLMRRERRNMFNRCCQYVKDRNFESNSQLEYR